MADEKVYSPATIPDQPLPGEGIEIPETVTSAGQQVYSQKTIPAKPMPTRKIAVELLSVALNTKSRKILKEFQFTPSGAIQIGTYENGVSGDIKISPDGIVARDKTGATSFTLDGDTGDATFRGNIQAGALISGLVDVGDNKIVIDGDARRMVFYDESGIPVIVIGNA